ncbi:hypothetical protein [Aquimarina algiphila]|uniref:hypothetical protein n=1 Tax=Aquimarina algiphila TaxID=2047982 RepID=UPI002490469B|nr:hypothetical protein [Aquimarina algiphila]
MSLVKSENVFTYKLMKILRRITPFRILGIISVLKAIYMLVTEKELEYRIYLVFALFVFVVILFLTDFGLNKWLKSYKKIVITELVLTLVIVVIYNYQFN